MFKKTILIASVALLSTTAMASEQHDLEISVGLVDSGAGVNASEGYSLGVKMELQHDIYASVEVRDLSDSKTQILEAGLSYDFCIGEKVSVATSASYLKYSFDNGMEDDNAFSLKAGLKAKSHGVILEAGMERIDMSNADYQDTSPYLSASVNLSEDIKLSFQHREALEESSVKVSWAF